MSTAYYALFHAIAQDAADLVGGGKNASRSEEAWRQTYRALQHGFARGACQEVRNLRFPAPICDCADSFTDLQKARQNADYDPFHRITRPDALARIAQAEQAIADLKGSSKRDRTAFVVQLLFPKRK